MASRSPSPSSKTKPSAGKMTRSQAASKAGKASAQGRPSSGRASAGTGRAGKSSASRASRSPSK